MQTMLKEGSQPALEADVEFVRMSVLVIVGDCVAGSSTGASCTLCKDSSGASASV